MIVKHVYELVTDDIYMRLDELASGFELLLKVEGLNPAGSIKLKTARSLIEDAERTGRLSAGRRVIESSSGNLGIALSMVCAARGYAFTCVVDPNTSPQAVHAMRSCGADVVEVNWRDPNGGYLRSRISYIGRRIAADPNLVWLNQYANEANPAVHARTTAAAILRDVGRVDYLFVGAGTTGTLMGCARHFRRNSPATVVVAVDAVGSVTFGHPPGLRNIPGIGTSRRPELVRREMVDDVVMVEEIDAIRTCRALARRRGLLVGGSTGSVLAAVAARSGGFRPGARVVAVAPDLGEKYLNTIYDDDWVRDKFGPDRTLMTSEGMV